MSDSTRPRPGRVLCAAVLLGALTAAQGARPGSALRGNPRLECEAATRVADPKLEGGGARFAFSLHPEGASTPVRATVMAGDERVRELWDGRLVGGAAPTWLTWDGRDEGGARCATGDYVVRLEADGMDPLELPLSVVRLGITEIEAQDGPRPGLDEFQMVYFKKGPSYGFFATPAIHEYVNVARPGELADLDLDDGSPRPVVAVHAGTASPVVEAGSYGTTTYNYPVAYLMGATPRLELTLGASAVGPDGAPMGVGYPVEGQELRLLCSGQSARARGGVLQPGDALRVDLAPLPDEAGRFDLELVLRWQSREVGARDWVDVPGKLVIPLRVYTLIAPPVFRNNPVGVQYAGPWVEVVDYLCDWKETLGITVTDQRSLTEAFVKGFVGQNGGIPTPIENVIYDAFPLGGDGGATHYVNGTTMRLSRLLDAHALGRFVNCTDNMGATTTMLSMMGAANMRPVRLGRMNLRAIWGIGAPAYTLNLWGNGHGFSYHHIVTDDNGATVSDTCMQLDEDGNPSALPGTPGWNTHRPWNGVVGYEDLSASNNVTKRLEALPGIN